MASVFFPWVALRLPCSSRHGQVLHKFWLYKVAFHTNRVNRMKTVVLIVIWFWWVVFQALFSVSIISIFVSIIWIIFCSLLFLNSFLCLWQGSSLSSSQHWYSQRQAQQLYSPSAFKPWFQPPFWVNRFSVLKLIKGLRIHARVLHYFGANTQAFFIALQD